MMPPRPDLQALGIRYRRIPLMAHGRNVYSDTRLILRKLESLFPAHPRLGASSPDQKGIERLLSCWTIDGGIFGLAARVIPPNAPPLQDPKFLQDRTEFMGRQWSARLQEKGRPEALAHFREGFELLETTLLADGRGWILKTEGPSLADIEAIWPFFWVLGMPGAIPESVASAKEFPGVFAWVERFRGAVAEAEEKNGKASEISGPDAVQYITSAQFAEQDSAVDANEPAGFKTGETVEMHPIDSGFAHKDVGKLVKLTKDEIVISVEAKHGQEVQLHAPRWGFRVQRSGTRL